jgi:hypothetical protein
LAAMIDWTYEMLSDEEKIVWRRISVFHGPFTIDAVDRVAHDRQTEHFNTGVILEKFGRKITGFSRLKRRRSGQISPA